jgi:hypothetical protein
MSSNGQIQYACGNRIIKSTNFGVSWSQVLGTNNLAGYDSIVTNSSGSYVVAVKNVGASANNYFVSTNGGSGWTQTRVGFNGTCVAISDNGSCQSIVNVSGGSTGIYVTTNSGSSWTTVNSTDGNFAWIAMSQSGLYQTATIQNGQIYVSSNSGTSWSAKGPSKDWLSVSMDSTGQYQSACASNDYTYVSTDYGNTWIAATQSPLANSRAIAVSSNAMYQTLVLLPGQI